MKTPTIKELRALAKKKGTWIIKADPSEPMYMIGNNTQLWMSESSALRTLSALPDKKVAR